MAKVCICSYLKSGYQPWKTKSGAKNAKVLLKQASPRMPTLPTKS